MSKKVQKKIIKLYRKFVSIIHYFKFLRKVHKIFWIFLQNISGRKNFKNNQISQLNIKKNNQIFKIIRTLNKQGYLIVEKNEIQDYLQKMHNLVIKKSNEIISNRNLLNKGYKGFKDYFQKIDINNFGNEYKLLLYKYFTNPFFIQIASNYLKDNALLTALNIRISPKETNIGNKFEGSQLWHSDHDDNKILKVFVVLKDINLNSGPLEVLNKNSSSEIMEKINYNWSSNDSHSDSIVNSEDGFEAMIGDKGSIIFVDTVSCFHRGSRMQKEDRLILEAHYLSRTSFRYPPINWLFPKFISKKFLILSNPLLRIDKDMSFIDSNALNI